MDKKVSIIVIIVLLIAAIICMELNKNRFANINEEEPTTIITTTSTTTESTTPVFEELPPVNITSGTYTCVENCNEITDIVLKTGTKQTCNKSPECSWEITDKNELKVLFMVYIPESTRSEHRTEIFEVREDNTLVRRVYN